MSKKINYSEGDCFSIPLREGGFGCGVVTRMDGNGIVFGYFFGPKVTTVAEISGNDLGIEQSIFCGQFGDLGFLNREWEVIGRVPNWSREQWSMPLFLRFDDNASTGCLSEYDEDSLKCIDEKKVQLSSIDIQNYPKDSVMGYGFVEIKLTKLLSS
ncbi:MAG: hypothetical protein ACI9SP_003028 [Arenicella sp.]|jgi:hypothetical protein